jgi:hypothetical protein
MMDRVIHAYGQQEGLDYTLFRPFNWIGAGPRLDPHAEGRQLARHHPVPRPHRARRADQAGRRRRPEALLHLRHDGIDALMKIIDNKDGIASGKIYNIGNPKNNYSVRELATMMLDLAAQYPEYADRAPRCSWSKRRRASTTARATRTPSTACRRSPTPCRPRLGAPVTFDGRPARHFRGLPQRRRRSPQADGLSAPSVKLTHADRPQDRCRYLSRHPAGRAAPGRDPAPLQRADATFLFSLGPDHTGRAIKRALRPGFMKKVQRTSVVSHYGIKTLMYGTLLPGPDIGRRGADIMRATRDAGFEVGDPLLGPRQVAGRRGKADATWTEIEMRRAHERYVEIFGTEAPGHGAAGWQMNPHALRLTQRLGFDWASDCRGTPLHPGLERGNRRLPATADHAADPGRVGRHGRPEPGKRAPAPAAADRTGGAQSRGNATTFSRCTPNSKASSSAIPWSGC